VLCLTCSMCSPPSHLPASRRQLEPQFCTWPSRPGAWPRLMKPHPHTMIHPSRTGGKPCGLSHQVRIALDDTSFQSKPSAIHRSWKCTLVTPHSSPGRCFLNTVPAEGKSPSCISRTRDSGAQFSSSQVLYSAWEQPRTTVRIVHPCTAMDRICHVCTALIRPLEPCC
jgi:hypothetical protein